MPDKKMVYACIALAMVLIFILEVIALSNGINGTILKISLSLIGGLAGYVANDLKKKNNWRFFK